MLCVNWSNLIFYAAGQCDAVGSIEDFQRHEIACGIIVQNHARSVLVAFCNRCIGKNNGQGISLAIVIDFHAPLLQYLTILLVR